MPIFLKYFWAFCQMVSFYLINYCEHKLIFSSFVCLFTSVNHSLIQCLWSISCPSFLQWCCLVFLKHDDEPLTGDICEMLWAGAPGACGENILISWLNIGGLLLQGDRINQHKLNVSVPWQCKFYIIVLYVWLYALEILQLTIWGSPPTGLHFGPILGCISVSLFKQARCKIFICVLYYSVIE